MTRQYRCVPESLAHSSWTTEDPVSVCGCRLMQGKERWMSDRSDCAEGGDYNERRDNESGSEATTKRRRDGSDGTSKSNTAFVHEAKLSSGPQKFAGPCLPFRQGWSHGREQASLPISSQVPVKLFNRAIYTSSDTGISEPSIPHQ